MAVSLELDGFRSLIQIRVDIMNGAGYAVVTTSRDTGQSTIRTHWPDRDTPTGEVVMQANYATMPLLSDKSPT
jgi:hypothetical protein